MTWTCSKMTWACSGAGRLHWERLELELPEDELEEAVLGDQQ